MNATLIDTMLWHIHREDMQRHGRDVARDLHKGGSYEEVINRVCHRIKYERDTL